MLERMYHDRFVESERWERETREEAFDAQKAEEQVGSARQERREQSFLSK